MSKSLGNYIGISEEPGQMFGKVMSVPDAAMWDYYTLVTDVPQAEIDELRTACEGGQMNPRDAKVRLAKTIVTEFYSDAAADQAAEEFDRIFRQGMKPEEIEQFAIAEDEVSLIDLLVNSGLASSKSNARQVIEQGGVRVDDEQVKELTATVTPTEQGVIVQKGKRHFIKVVKK
jgi:tyrosyl-tRNA synthetase